ncbi:MAG: hypothetical protein Q9182_005677 [Xanthomendoza sp. 2 TL-2023]
MSSGFVSGGTTDKPIERDDEWVKAQLEIEAIRRRKEEEGKQDGGKSLYEVLQSNKAAKQEAFEESIRLKNQFRNLDEDEVEFLDSVLESTRAREDAVKKETAEQLKAFRRQQEEADKASLSGTTTTTEPAAFEGTSSRPEASATDSHWAINARKRKRVRDKDAIPGIKLRKSSSTSEKPTVPKAGSATSFGSEEATIAQDFPCSASERPEEFPQSDHKAVESTQAPDFPGSSKPVVGALGLAAYSSDEDA